MKRNKDRGKRVPPPFPMMHISQEERARLAMRQEEIYAAAEFLGIPVMTFDSGISTEKPWETDQYKADSAYALGCILAGTPVPQDVQDRLLIVKKQREQAGMLWNK